jgi:hypothetical protein
VSGVLGFMITYLGTAGAVVPRGGALLAPSLVRVCDYLARVQCEWCRLVGRHADRR